VSTSVLVGYATRYGSTQEVAEAVAATLRECGLAVDIRPMQEVRTLAGYSAVVLGASLLLAGKEPASDLRDWTAIRTWASNLAAKLEPALP
jgi:menaquinone-dependent protoporphyrinogen IX oxidase